MSFKRKFISTVGLALAVGTFSTFVAAQDNGTTNQTDSTKKERTFEGRGAKGMHGGKHEGGDRMMMGALRQLNLTDTQKAQIKTIFESNKPNQTQFEQVRGLMQKNHDGTITADEQATLDSFRAQRKATEKQTHDSILAILTPEQRTQLEQLKQQNRQRHEERKEMKNNTQTPNTSDNN